MLNCDEESIGKLSEQRIMDSPRLYWSADQGLAEALIQCFPIQDAR